MRSDTRGKVLAALGLLALALAVAPQALVALVDLVLPTRVATVVGPLSVAVLGAVVAVTAGNEMRESDVIGDKARLTAAIGGGIALIVGVPLALLGLTAL